MLLKNAFVWLLVLHPVTTQPTKSIGCDDSCVKISKLDAILEKISTLQKEHSCSYSRNCADVLRKGNTKSGVYKVVAFVDQYGPAFIDVYCDMDTDGGGWLVFQRRKDGTVDFYKDWLSYSNGFGSLTGEFWLGNKYLHQFSSQSVQELRIDMRDGAQEMRYALYQSFHIGPEADKFRLHLSGFTGNAGDSLIGQNNMQFSTKDHDNDENKSSCATLFKGGWWYINCHSSNLNGLYLNGTHSSYADGIEWQTWHGYYYSLQFTEMKMRPADV